MTGMTKIDEKHWLELTPDLRPSSADDDFYPGAIFYKYLLFPGCYFLKETPDIVYMDENETIKALGLEKEKEGNYTKAVLDYVTPKLIQANIKLYEYGLRKFCNITSKGIAEFNKDGLFFRCVSPNGEIVNLDDIKKQLSNEEESKNKNKNKSKNKKKKKKSKIPLKDQTFL